MSKVPGSRYFGRGGGWRRKSVLSSSTREQNVIRNACVYCVQISKTLSDIQDFNPRHSISPRYFQSIDALLLHLLHVYWSYYII